MSNGSERTRPKLPEPWEYDPKKKPFDHEDYPEIPEILEFKLEAIISRLIDLKANLDIGPLLAALAAIGALLGGIAVTLIAIAGLLAPKLVLPIQTVLLMLIPIFYLILKALRKKR